MLLQINKLTNWRRTLRGGVGAALRRAVILSGSSLLFSWAGLAARLLEGKYPSNPRRARFCWEAGLVGLTWVVGINKTIVLSWGAWFGRGCWFFGKTRRPSRGTWFFSTASLRRATRSRWPLRRRACSRWWRAASPTILLHNWQNPFTSRGLAWSWLWGGNKLLVFILQYWKIIIVIGIKVDRVATVRAILMGDPMLARHCKK